MPLRTSLPPPRRAVVGRALDRAAVDAAEYSAHSLRAGFATEAAAHGVPEHVIMRQGRWRHAATVKRYIRAGDLFSENVSQSLGL